MKFAIKKEAMYPLLQYAINFTSLKNINQILQNVLIEAADNRVFLKTTSFQTGFSCKIDADIISFGLTTVPAKILCDIIKAIPDESVIDFIFEGSALNIKTGRTSYQLPTMDATLFPNSPAITPEYSFEIKAGQFLSLLKRVAFCISSDTLKTEYNGAHMNIVADKIELSSADFQRIATTSATFENAFSDEFTVNIPKKTVFDIIKIFENAEKIRVITDKRQISFSTDNITITSRLIEKYIKSITRLFLAEYKLKAIMNREKLIGVVKRIAPITSELTHGLLFSFQNSQLTVTSPETENGKGTEIMDGIEFEGENIDIVFNAKHLLEILSNIDSPEVVFAMNAKTQPALILPVNDCVKYLLVPISIEKIT
ncbi:MAG: DNA polymerase III subunit beta [Deferribacteraceae bacterium]|jgi:DNA polymerase-3 subunit beta|nr:DNA polymerase III subunit beta [Deferribacteraceae bacterium]